MSMEQVAGGSWPALQNNPTLVAAPGRDPSGALEDAYSTGRHAGAGTGSSTDPLIAPDRVLRARRRTASNVCAGRERQDVSVGRSASGPQATVPTYNNVAGVTKDVP
jgi:hypothetical protein